jgi:beta-lactamase regulating signal transducer with metallopeptidase domain
MAFLTRNSSLIAAIWLAMLSIKMTRMLFVLGFTRHIMGRKTRRSPMYWQDRLAQLCREWQIDKTVNLFESTSIKLPVVYGQLKPVILVPLGFLTQLPAAEIESILLHELAHIRRSDYLVNILQNLIEAIFFFNPGLVWLSSLIRDERENCCDDLAIGKLKDTRQYVESLIRFRERSLYAHPLAAVGFAGRKNSFINRIRRIVDKKNYTLSRFETGSLVCSVVIASLMALFVATTNKTQAMTIRAIAPAPASVRQVAVSYTPAIKPVTLAGIHPRQPAHHPNIHTSVIKDTLIHSKPDTGLHSYEAVGQRMHQVIADLVKEGVVSDSAAVQAFQLDMTVLKVNGRPQPYALQQKLAVRYGIRPNAGLYYGQPKKPGHDYFIAEGSWQEEKRLSIEHAHQAAAQAREDLARKSQELTLRRQEMVQKDSVRTHFLEPVISDIIDDLAAAGIVNKRTDVVSFLLTNRELVVNHLLQPEAVHQTFRKKYILHNTSTRAFSNITADPNFGWQFNARTGSMGIGYHQWGNASD